MDAPKSPRPLLALCRQASEALLSGDPAALAALERSEFHPLLPPDFSFSDSGRWKALGRSWLRGALSEPSGSSAEWLARRFPLALSARPDPNAPVWMRELERSSEPALSARALAAFERIPLSGSSDDAAAWARLASSSPEGSSYLAASLPANPAWLSLLSGGSSKASASLPLFSELAHASAAAPSPAGSSIAEWLASSAERLCSERPELLPAFSRSSSRLLLSLAKSLPPACAPDPLSRARPLLRLCPESALFLPDSSRPELDPQSEDALSRAFSSHLAGTLGAEAALGSDFPTFLFALREGWIRPAVFSFPFACENPAAVRRSLDQETARLGRRPDMSARFERIRSTAERFDLPPRQIAEILLPLDLSVPFPESHGHPPFLTLPGLIPVSPQAWLLCAALLPAYRPSRSDPDFLAARCRALSEAGYPLSEAFASFPPHARLQRSIRPAKALLEQPWARSLLEREALDRSASAPSRAARPAPRRI